jgi:hypothetical protein
VTSVWIFVEELDGKIDSLAARARRVGGAAIAKMNRRDLKSGAWSRTVN